MPELKKEEDQVDVDQQVDEKDSEKPDAAAKGAESGKEQDDQSAEGRAEPASEQAAAGDAVSDGEADLDQEEPLRGRFQKRIDTLTRQKREAERQREEAIKYAKSVMDENSRLRDRGVGVAESALGTAEARYTAEYEVAKRDLKEAFEAGDADKIAESQSRIASIAVERSRLKDYAGKIKEEKEAKPTPKERQESEQLYQAPDPRASEWAEKNPWFGKDEVATQVAWTLHGRLVRSGVDPRTDEYWSKLDNALRDELPHKFKANQAPAATGTGQAQRPQTSAVASARRSGQTSAKSVQLTPSQEHIVRRLGITREAYLASLKAMEN